jgi:hypothetical protein
MSSCEILFFKNGKPKKSIKFRNAWGGASFIWTAMYDKYLKNPETPYDTWLCKGDGAGGLWDLWKNRDIPFNLRVVHVSTFDYAIVRQEHFTQFAADLEQFLIFFGKQDKVCHLPGWAKAIRENLNFEAVGFYHTSVSDNPWIGWDSKKDAPLPYNLKKGDKHFEVYDEMEKLEMEEEKI